MNTTPQRPCPSPGSSGPKRKLSPRQIAEQKKRARRRRCVGIALFALLLFCIVMLVRAIDRATTRPVMKDTDVIAVGNRDTRVPEETEPVAEPVIPTPTVQRPVADGATLSLGDAIDSQYAVLITEDTASVIAQKNGNARIYPASLTKIMSLIVAYEAIDDLSATFTVTSGIIDPLYLSEATLAGFAPGEVVTVQDLLYGMVLPSGAEASVSLAIHTAGSEEAFVERMNEKAKEMGLTSTHFTNCSGLHDAEHYSTCTEMAMILAYALQYPMCREILSTYQYTTTPTEKHPEGVLLTSTMFSRAHGDEPTGATILAGKTGYTHQAHHCLASYGQRERDGAGFILVTVDAPGKFEPIFDAIHVYSDYIHK